MGTARRLRFGFTPFNAPPTAVEFDVHGFEGPLAAMSKTCAPAATRGPAGGRSLGPRDSRRSGAD
jgi:hypothetical protein